LEKEKTSWKRMKFRKNKVWLNIDEKGDPIVKNGKVLIKYQLEQDYEYWVHENGVQPIDDSDADKIASDRKPDKYESNKKSGTEFEGKGDEIVIYTDGASSGNPGPSGIGILLRFGNHEREISKHIGSATNNIAELEAIRVALLELKRTDLPIKVFTDSSYAFGVLTLGWKAKKNTNLVKSIKKIISKFSDLKFQKVKGHVGIDGNERANYLATAAVKKLRPKNL
jgi:ribonuclease HI